MTDLNRMTATKWPTVHHHLTSPFSLHTLARIHARAMYGRISTGHSRRPHLQKEGTSVKSLTFPAWRRTSLLAAVLAVVVAAAGVIGASASTAKKQKVAYLSFAVANTYDAPMLSAA